MPVHGISLDIEFASIILGATAASYFLQGEIVSNVMFTTLIAVLFFMIGLHLELDKLKKCTHHLKSIGVGWAVIYLFAPLLALLVSSYTGGALGNAFLAIGVSAAAIGSPVVFSNRAKGEGELSLIISGTSLIAGIILMPLLMLLVGLEAPFQQLAFRNMVFIGAPLLLGIAGQRFENRLFDDFRHHFSKLGLWLLATLMAVQGYLVYSSQGTVFLANLLTAAVLMTLYVLASYTAGYGVSRLTGLLEKESRTVGITAASKNLALSLFIASQLGGEVVAYVLLYYFVRQGVTGGISEFYRRGLSFSRNG